jgi:hypothetical protein
MFGFPTNIVLDIRFNPRNDKCWANSRRTDLGIRGIRLKDELEPVVSGHSRSRNIRAGIKRERKSAAKPDPQTFRIPSWIEWSFAPSHFLSLSFALLILLFWVFINLDLLWNKYQHLHLVGQTREKKKQASLIDVTSVGQSSCSSPATVHVNTVRDPPLLTTPSLLCLNSGANSASWARPSHISLPLSGGYMTSFYGPSPCSSTSFSARCTHEDHGKSPVAVL